MRCRVIQTCWLQSLRWSPGRSFLVCMVEPVPALFCFRRVIANARRGAAMNQSQLPKDTVSVSRTRTSYAHYVNHPSLTAFRTVRVLQSPIPRTHHREYRQCSVPIYPAQHHHPSAHTHPVPIAEPHCTALASHDCARATAVPCTVATCRTKIMWASQRRLCRARR